MRRIALLGCALSVFACVKQPGLRPERPLPAAPTAAFERVSLGPVSLSLPASGWKKTCFPSAGAVILRCTQDEKGTDCQSGGRIGGQSCRIEPLAGKGWIKVTVIPADIDWGDVYACKDGETCPDCVPSEKRCYSTPEVLGSATLTFPDAESGSRDAYVNLSARKGKADIRIFGAWSAADHDRMVRILDGIVDSIKAN